MDDSTTLREDGTERPDIRGNQASGTARSGQPDEDASGGAVDATLRGDPGTPRAMGLGSEPAPALGDPAEDLDDVERPE